MKIPNIKKLYFPIGLLALVSAFGIGYFTKIPDFLDGFLKGIGITWVIVGIIMYWNKTDDSENLGEEKK